MLNRPASGSPACRRLLALACLSVLGLSAGPAVALSPLDTDPASGLLLAQGGAAGSEPRAQGDPETPFADLEKVLQATRAKLEELTNAMATLSGGAEPRKELQLLERDNERLAAELVQANARWAELERSSRLAEARIAELTETVDKARREAARDDEALARLRRQNGQLDQSLTRANAARDAALAEAEKTRAQMAKEVEAATDAAAQSRAELASLRQELEVNHQELTRATAREAQLGKLEAAAADAERLKAELAAVKEQLGQAASAAVEAERARQAAGDEAESLRRDAGRAREGLVAANTEIAHLKITNAELEKEVTSWRTSSTSAITTARQNLLMMEEKIEELSAALVVGQPKEGLPGLGRPPKSATIADQRATATQSLSAMAQAEEAVKPSATGLATVSPAAAPAGTDPRLARFQADIQTLNDVERSAAGGQLFSGVESMSGSAVHVGAAAAWDALPPVGKESYLDSLLGLWVAAQGGQGPAVVRIVDSSGRILGEKSRP